MEQQDAILGFVPTVGERRGERRQIIKISVRDGRILLGPQDETWIPWVLEEGPALVLGTILQLAVQAVQAERLRKLRNLG